MIGYRNSRIKRPKKTVIISTPRSASQHFCRQYKIDNKIKNLGELLNPRLYPQKQLTGEQYIQQQIDLWYNYDNTMCKIFPFHITNLINNCDQQQLTEYCKQIAEGCDKIVYLYRRDTTRQVISSIISEKTDVWKPKRSKPDDINITPAQFERYSMSILRNHKQVLEIKKQLPGVSICSEDYLQGSQFQKYKHQYENNDNYCYNLENIEQLYKL